MTCKVHAEHLAGWTSAEIKLWFQVQNNATFLLCSLHFLHSSPVRCDLLKENSFKHLIPILEKPFHENQACVASVWSLLSFRMAIHKIFQKLAVMSAGVFWVLTRVLEFANKWMPCYALVGCCFLGMNYLSCISSKNWWQIKNWSY